MLDCIVIAVLNGIEISHKLFTPEMVADAIAIRGCEGKRRYRPQTISATNDISHKPYQPQHAPYRPHTMSISATS